MDLHVHRSMDVGWRQPMSDHLRLASADPGKHVWERAQFAWHAAFAVLALLTATLVLVDGELSQDRRVLALALLVALSGWYATAGARALHQGESRAGLRYLAVAGPIVVTLFWITPSGAVMQFILYPHLWSMLPLRGALTGTVGTVLSVTAVAFPNIGPERFVQVAVLTATALVVAVLLGLWISTIIDQSRQRAELLVELERTRAQLATMSHETGVLAERERVAREIHDTLAQGFTSILMLLQSTAGEVDRDPAGARCHLAQAERVARENLAEARLLVAAMSPAELGSASLPDALSRIVERLGQELGVAAVLTIDGRARQMPVAHDVVLLRAAQEALANIRKHAGASRIDVGLIYEPGRVLVAVRDDGCGFDPANTNGGFGLGGMRRRVDEVGGTLELCSAPGTGTTVRVALPDPA
ncbi:MAG: sensor histidine kinase [Actinomycetia bacterium]|nr:sensor histidine kinase [Actinomycetes bacterium]